MTGLVVVLSRGSENGGSHENRAVAQQPSAKPKSGTTCAPAICGLETGMKCFSVTAFVVRQTVLRLRRHQATP